MKRYRVLRMHGFGVVSSALFAFLNYARGIERGRIVVMFMEFYYDEEF